MQLDYFKDIRALALLATSFGLDLVRQQIDFAGELAAAFGNAPRRSARTAADDTSPLRMAAHQASNASADTRSRRGGGARFHDRVEKRAYELWEQEGHPEGRQLLHWLAAEGEILKTRRVAIDDAAATVLPRAA